MVTVTDVADLHCNVPEVPYTT